MSKVFVRLKKDSVRDRLSTISGYSIVKEEYTEVDDNEQDIKSILIYRNDVEIKDVNNSNDIKEVSKKKKNKQTSKNNKSDVKKNNKKD